MPVNYPRTYRFLKLQAWRAALADDMGIPSYKVCSDRHILQISLRSLENPVLASLVDDVLYFTDNGSLAPALVLADYLQDSDNTREAGETLARGLSKVKKCGNV